MPVPPGRPAPPGGEDDRHRDPEGRAEPTQSAARQLAAVPAVPQARAHHQDPHGDDHARHRGGPQHGRLTPEVVHVAPLGEPHREKPEEGRGQAGAEETDADAAQPGYVRVRRDEPEDRDEDGRTRQGDGPVDPRHRAHADQQPADDRDPEPAGAQGCDEPCERRQRRDQQDALRVRGSHQVQEGDRQAERSLRHEREPGPGEPPRQRIDADERERTDDDVGAERTVDAADPAPHAHQPGECEPALAVHDTAVVVGREGDQRRGDARHPVLEVDHRVGVDAAVVVVPEPDAGHGVDGRVSRDPQELRGVRQVEHGPHGGAEYRGDRAEDVGPAVRRRLRHEPSDEGQGDQEDGQHQPGREPLYGERHRHREAEREEDEQEGVRGHDHGTRQPPAPPAVARRAPRGALEAVDRASAGLLTEPRSDVLHGHPLCRIAVQL